MSNANKRSAHIFNQIIDVELQPQMTRSSEGELSAATSHDDLLKAILGSQPATPDERGRLLEVVEAQVRGIREDLGIPPPPLPPSFSEFVRSRQPDSAGFLTWETDGWIGRSARALSRVLASTTWRRRPVLLVLVAGGAVILGVAFGAGPSRPLPMPVARVLQAAPVTPAVPIPPMPDARTAPP